MVSSLEKRGVVFLGKGNYNWLRAGDRGLLTRTPILKPDDLKGYKLRMFQAEAPIKAWAAFGANIQVIPWPDTYTALATGTVDGLTTVLSAYLTKQTEAVRFFTNVAEYYQIVVPVMSKRTFDKLTPEQRAIFETAAKEAGLKYLEVSAAEAAEYDRKAQNDHGVTIIIPPMKPWLDVAKTVFASSSRTISCQRACRTGPGDQVAVGQASNRTPMALRKALAAIGVVELWIALWRSSSSSLLAITQVGYRYLLAGSIWWAQEISQLAMLVAYFGIAYVYKAKQDIIVGFLSTGWRGVSGHARGLRADLIALVCLFLVITGLELAPSQLVFYTYILNIPRFYSTLPLIVASASMA